MNVFDGILDWIEDFLNVIVYSALQSLPDSPFAFTLDPEVKKILGYINWFIPFDLISNALYVWTGAVIAYYLVQVILRWGKAIS